MKFGEDGWFTCGNDGTTDESYEIKGDFTQNEQRVFTFANTSWDKEWCFMRRPVMENYELSDDKAVLHGLDITLDNVDSPTSLQCAA